MLCKKCGKDNQEGAIFCTGCGSDLNEKVHLDPELITKKPSPPSPPSYQPYVAPTSNVNSYQQSYNSQESLDKPLTVKDYLIMFLLLSIPFANIVLIFVWAFSESINTNKKNFCKSYLIFTGIMTAVYLVFMVFIFAITSVGNLNY